MKKLLFLMVVLAMLVSLFIPVAVPASAAVSTSSATITTDKTRYSVGEPMVISGSGFTASGTINITVQEPGNNGVDSLSATADDAGSFQVTYNPPMISGRYKITATDGTNTALTATTEADAAAANLDQGANGKASAPVSPVGWQNGNLNENGAHYMEGYSIPYRVIMTDLPTGSSNPITIEIGWDIKSSGANAIDFITYYRRLEPHAGFGHPAELVQPLDGVTGVSSTVTTFAIPAPSSAGSPVAGQPTAEFNSLPAAEKVMTLFGGTITGMAYGTQGSLTANDSESTMDITFWADSSTAVLSWGGHIAEASIWGAGNSATGISGSPYHTRLKTWTLGNLGNQDRSLKATAVVAPGTIKVVKNTVGGDGTFSYTATGLGMSNFDITTSSGTGNWTFANLVAGSTGGSRSVTETVPAGWTLTTPISITSALGTSTFSSSGATATVSNLGNGDTVTITYTDTATGCLKIVKNTTGGDGTFGYTVSGGLTTVADQSITTSGGTGNVTVCNLIAGTYTVTEKTLPAGWGNDTAMVQSVTVPVNGTGTATFSNTATGCLKIVKNTTGGDGTFGYTVSGGLTTVADQSITTSGGTGNVTICNLIAGTYTVTEKTLPAGWGNDTAMVQSVTVPINGTGTATFSNTATGCLKIVKNTTGGDGTFDFTVTGDWGGLTTVADQTITTSGGTGNVTVCNLIAGNYTVTEKTLPVGWMSNDASMTQKVTVPINGTGTVTYSNTKLATIILVKNSSDGDSTFTFSATVLPSPISITTSGGTGSQTFSNLVPGDYGNITENAKSGWVLTVLGFTSALGTSTVSVNQTTGVATISVLAAGDTVTVTFDNTAVGLGTRTQGFWATHRLLSDAVWFGGTVGGHTYTGLSVSDQTICNKVIDSDCKLMGAFWSNIAKTSTDAKRSKLDQARMQMLQQLVAAILNNAAFGSDPTSFGVSISQAKADFCGTDLNKIKADIGYLGSFNSSGDTVAFTPGINANGKDAKDHACNAFWDVLP